MSKEVMAQQLFDNGDVNQIDPDTFVCHGSNGNQYHIKRETNPAYNYEFYCKCPAWKFDSSRKCKHVIAVQLFEQKNKMKPSKLSQQPNQPSHTHTVSKAKPKATLRSKRKTKSTYKIKKDGNKNTMDWTEPDGSKTKFEFDEDGNLIGKVSK